MKPLNILLLCVRPAANSWASTVLDHIESFERFSKHKIRCFGSVATVDNGNLPESLDLNRFDVLVIHYSVEAFSQLHFSDQTKARIRSFKGLKIQFLQDEFQHIHSLFETIQYLGIDVVYTVIGDENRADQFYPRDKLPGITRLHTLTGYVPAKAKQLATVPVIERPIDVGYRGRKNPYWFGALGVEKWAIVDQFKLATSNAGLRCDLSYREEDRIYGKRWFDFLLSCKAVLGVESGASSIDFDGTLKRAVDSYVAENPSASFEEIREKFLSDDWKYAVVEISPRCFEAAATKTPMILYEGRYSDILVPERHYIVLKKDYSNIDDVVAKVKDPVYLQELADCTYEEIACSSRYSYANFVAEFDRIVEREFHARGRKRAAKTYSGIEYFKDTEFALKINDLKKTARSSILDLWYSIPEHRRQTLKPRLKRVLDLYRGNSKSY